MQNFFIKIPDEEIRFLICYIPDATVKNADYPNPDITLVQSLEHSVLRRKSRSIKMPFKELSVQYKIYRILRRLQV